MKLNIVALLFSAFVLIPFASASQDPVPLTNQSGATNLAPSLEFFEDSESEFGPESIRHLASKHWSSLPADSNGANFGFTTSSYWFRFTLHNADKDTGNFLVHLDYALIDEIDFFSVQNNAVTEQYHLGDLLPFNQRPIEYPTFLFPVSLKAGESKQIYMRVASSGPIQVPLSAWSESEFLINKQSFMFLYGAFLSALLIMSAYNLCLYFIVRSRSYLLYSTFILFMAGVHGSLDGFAYQWFWPDSPGWHQISTIFFISLGVLSTVIFTRSVLPIPEKSKLQLFVRLLTYVALATAAVSFFLPYSIAATLNGVTTVIVMGGVCVTCIAMLNHSPRVARLICAAWGIYFFGIVLKSSSKMGYIESTLLSENAGNIGGVIGVIVISLALADRINNERRAKEIAQKQSIGNLQRFENLYQKALEGIFSFSLGGELISANPAFLSMLGLSDVDSFNRQKLRARTFALEPNAFDRLIEKLDSHKELVNHELQIRSLVGKHLWINVSARLSYDENKDTTVVEGTAVDITDRKNFEAQLLHLASHDPLTGFYNRRAFEEEAKRKLDAVQSYSEACCLLYLDLDQFKIVNDLCGHTAGDVLLKNLSQRLMDNLESMNDAHIIARLGGDEFGILLSNTKLTEGQKVAEQLRESIEKFLFVWDGNRFSLGVSIGLVELCPFHHSVEQLLVMADTACYKAKDQGRNRVHTFIESDKELQFRQLEMQWVSTIKEAIKEDLFFLVFQNISSNRESGEAQYHYEILLRLMTAQGNLCAPNQFLPAAERYNLMPNIDQWVLSNYFKWLRAHPEHLEYLGCASINLSTQSIGDESFLKFLMGALEEYAIPPEKICFEITESMAISNLDNTHSFISKLRQLGCRFALDDFGTGFSSYAYLKDLQVDYLKIDGVFIQNLNEDSVNTAMVKSISDVAKAMEIETIAEFVETEEIRQKLIDIGVSYSQGYHIHKPEKLETEAFSPINANP